MPTALRIPAGLLVGGLLLAACTRPLPEPSTSPDPGTRIYHVQLRITEDKGRAAAVLSRAQRWWTQTDPSDRPSLVSGVPSSDPAVSIEWKAPYYRVRLGPFATKQQAQTVLKSARSDFPDAFVVPDRVEAPS